MELRKLIVGVPGAELIGPGEVQVSGVWYDSRRAGPGSLFVAVPGFKADGHDFIPQALAQGAVALAVQANRRDKWEEAVAGAGAPTLVVPDTRRALAALAAAFYDHPARKLGVIGVTGTDGKTSVVHLTAHVLESAGWRTGLMSTVEGAIGGDSIAKASPRTTPEAPDVQATLAEMVEAGCRYAVIESSSHGLAMHRLDGCEYDVAVMTNVGIDHMDFHGSQDAYLLAKARLFTMLAKGANKGMKKKAVLNVDDASWQRIRSLTEAEVMTYGVHGRADVQAGRIEQEGWGSRFLLATRKEETTVRLNRPGRFNVYNALAAAAVGLELGMKVEAVAAALESWPGVPGRMELIDEGQPFKVVVDYAHAPEALRQVLELLRSLSRGRIIAVFGGAGERAPERRFPMGQIAAELADYTIITDDDPRSEDREAIIEGIAAGLRAAGRKEGHDFAKIADRGEAVAQALAMAVDEDVVLLAGKGHERTITVGDSEREHDDREVARRLLRRVVGGA